MGLPDPRQDRRADAVGLPTLIGQIVVYGITVYIAYVIYRSSKTADEATPEPAT